METTHLLMIFVGIALVVAGAVIWFIGTDIYEARTKPGGIANRTLRQLTSMVFVAVGLITLAQITLSILS